MDLLGNHHKRNKLNKTLCELYVAIFEAQQWHAQIIKDFRKNLRTNRDFEEQTIDLQVAWTDHSKLMSRCYDLIVKLIKTTSEDVDNIKQYLWIHKLSLHPSTIKENNLAYSYMPTWCQHTYERHTLLTKVYHRFPETKNITEVNNRKMKKYVESHRGKTEQKKIFKELSRTISRQYEVLHNTFRPFEKIEAIDAQDWDLVQEYTQQLGAAGRIHDHISHQ